MPMSGGNNLPTNTEDLVVPDWLEKRQKKTSSDEEVWLYYDL